MRCPKAVARLPRRRCGRDQGASSRWERGPRLVAPEPPVPRMGQGRRRWGLGCGRRPTALPALTARATRPAWAQETWGTRAAGSALQSPSARHTPEPPFSADRRSFGLQLLGGSRARHWGSHSRRAGGCRLRGAEAGGGRRGPCQLKRGWWTTEGTEPGRRRPPRAPWRSAGRALCGLQNPRPAPFHPPGPGGVCLEPAGRPFDLVCRRG